jgi:hypothetical protein
MSVLCEVCNWPNGAYSATNSNLSIICDECWAAMKPILLSRLQLARRLSPKPKDVETAGSSLNRYKSIESAYASGIKKGAGYVQNMLYIEQYFKLIRTIRGIDS